MILLRGHARQPEQRLPYRNAAMMAAVERIDPERKLATRHRMRGQIAALLHGMTPALAPQRATLMAILILEFMKMVVAVGKSDGAEVRQALLNELSEMLGKHIAVI